MHERERERERENFEISNTNIFHYTEIDVTPMFNIDSSQGSVPPLRMSRDQ